VSAMREQEIVLRRAEMKDSRLLWELANDPGVRQSAFCEASIPWEEHTSWFSAKMRDRNCIILIGEEGEGKPIGQMRVDLRGDSDGEIDVSLTAERRGSGCGSLLIDLGVREIFSTTAVAQLHAFIRTENVRSISAFERAGFSKRG